MSFPFVVLNHMAKNQRTYQWVNGRIQNVDAVSTERPRRPSMGIQTGLLVFMLSSVTMVFAGGALVVFAVALYAVLFG
ncbi:hypothetical protein BFL40_29925 [Pseudomonas costantinii]|uniref:Uncharacterized protein n=1 Tax=Pseudomonas costantinii TaxID=168469 RepID=A0A1S2UF26_9PSED|nr:hypothetical protein BFL40_29925 [Pseudomonas costantinii]